MPSASRSLLVSESSTRRSACTCEAERVAGAPVPSLTVRVSVDGVEALTKTFAGQASVGVALAGQRWHLVTLDVDRLLPSGTRRIGARLLGLELAGRRI